mmetsp:Transcript_12427/g.20606  ORF Transcript_12427/g.20606 Transcript_12427/m.20606 type:complete len:318 (+) Transcript_12427:88-1041(+)|eukprot:CAMPEP_0119015082 /NCGR_PEP_ID=MMETSP1176-20130426/10547_1 /TAXON_ID=265551 /ORGANISM="Synedropsis recta cf, Strain CCMP1620" /LENGTH=317 /DNA_ID=CAMNT_0006968347 /DNA_START=88 /DNA_END=1041 /DNA_ORIENTATION=-
MAWINFLLILNTLSAVASGLANNRAFLVTGGNKGQGYALCERILQEHDDTHVFLCSRDPKSGEEACKRLGFPDRVDVIPLDVTEEASIQAAVKQVRERLGENGNSKLEGFVSNAGILWGYSLEELLDVCTVGVVNVVDAFLPLMNPDGGKVIIVSSGLSPLMHTFSTHQDILMNGSWDENIALMEKVRSLSGKGPETFEESGFSGGPFAESAPDFHMYGLAKMFADSYMINLARAHPKLIINSCDPGLVYTDLIDRMPKYAGKPIEETGAKSPREGVEVHMRLLFGESDEVRTSGSFFAINKDGDLKSGPIDKRPDV